MQIRVVLHDPQSSGFAGQIEDLPATVLHQAQGIDGDMSVNFQCTYFAADRLGCLQHLQGDGPGDGASHRVDHALEICPVKVAVLECLNCEGEKIALGQRAEVVRRGLPERRQLPGVARAEIDAPEFIQHITAQQSHFIALIKAFGLRPVGVETAVERQQVCVVLIGGAKTLDHQLREGQRLVRFLLRMFPAGESQGAALRGPESMEVNPVRIGARQTFIGQ